MTCCRCNQTASAWMTFQYASGRIQIQEIPDVRDSYGGYPMCERHADRLSPPLGWDLSDFREGALTLFPVTSELDALQDRAPAADSDVA